MRCSRRSVLALGGLSLVRRGFSQTDSGGERLTLPAELQHLVSVGDSLGPEFGTYTRIAVQRRVPAEYPNANRIRRQVLEDALAMVASARRAYPVVAADGRSPAMQSVEGQMAISSIAALDRLSLETGTLLALAEMDAAAAAERLLAMPIPRTTMSGCDVFLRPDFTVYYDALAQMASRLTAKDREIRQRLWQQTRDTMGALATPGELAGAALHFGRGGWSADEREELLVLAAGAVGRMPALPDGFWTEYEAAHGKVMSLEPGGGAGTLRASWAEFLSRAQQAYPCSREAGEAEQKAYQMRLDLMRQAVSEGMQTRERMGPIGMAGSWSMSTAKPDSAGFRVRLLFKDDRVAGLRRQALSLVQQYGQRLRGTARNSPMSEEEATQQYESLTAGLQDYLADVPADPAMRFEEACEIWRLMVMQTWSAPWWAEEMRGFAAFLEREAAQGVDPSSWKRHGDLWLSFRDQAASQKVAVESLTLSGALAALDALKRERIGWARVHFPGRSTTRN